MQTMSMQWVADVTGCKGTYEGHITGVCTDSREILRGSVFVALVGERFDGHDYIDQALAGGAAFAIAQTRRTYQYQDRVLYVDNTQRALMEIARNYRRQFPLHCVAVTGSVGKTTTKDMVAEVLDAWMPTLKTEANLNNEIGLPKTLLELDASHKAAVLEMGMQGLGEIALLSYVAQPTVGVITNIGVSHIMQLGSRENICRAKLELAQTLPDGAPLLLCGDDDLLAKVDIPRLKVLFYGLDPQKNSIYARDIKDNGRETTFTICYSGQTVRAELPCVGEHNIRNALAAYAVGRLCGVPSNTCAGALLNYEPSGMRQKIVAHNGYTVVEDCYNASPNSMHAALNTLADYPCTGRRIAVLGDMLELGSISRKAHVEVGAHLASKGIDCLLAYGKDARYYLDGVNSDGVGKVHFTDIAELTLFLRGYVRPGDVVWFKASRGMELERVIQGIYES